MYCSNGDVFFKSLFTQLACALITLSTHNTCFQNPLSFIMNQSIHMHKPLFWVIISLIMHVGVIYVRNSWGGGRGEGERHTQRERERERERVLSLGIVSVTDMTLLE